MTEIRYNEKEYSIEFKGHAGAGAKGEDLVCAGVSTLYGTLRATCEEYSECLAPETETGDGTARVTLRPEKGYEWSAVVIMRTVFIGCCLLAENYPEYVKAVSTDEEIRRDGNVRDE